MGAVVAAVAAQRARQERELIEHLRAAKAFSSASATALRPQRAMGQAILRKLLSEQAVVQTGDLYWLNEAAYEVMRAQRMRNAQWSVGVVLILATIAAITAWIIRGH